ncbi:plasmid replication, integration and excision activator [Sphaerisporangium sp. B11E5]|uniref:plasmid replication, integration and excision activator n=1 Tax=Sphaerisporangium sp. B11E5 TaxID=3153563 RepID=UPI00325C9E98
MAIPHNFRVTFDEAFPHGCYMVGEVEQVKDFEASTASKPVFARDKATGEFVWQVTVVDCDPEARDKTVKIKVSSPVRPVPPAPLAGLPFIPVEFDGMTVTPWLNGQRIAYSVRAREMRAPRAAGKPSAGSAAGKDAA